MTPELINQIKAARRVSVPLVGITTPDPAATITAIMETVTGPALQWTVVDGFQSLNEAGNAVRGKLVGEQDPTLFNPPLALQLAKKLPGQVREPKTQGSVMFMHLANRLITDPATIQAVWNLRDEFKRDQRMLVLLGIDAQWPAELAGDIVTLDEPLPTAADLTKIFHRCHEGAGVDMTAEYSRDVVPRAVEALQGLPAFQAEQIVSMSMSRAGVAVDALWERKRRQIELTPGLKVQREPVKFDDIGGVKVIKDYLGRIMAGHARPNAIVFIDEIEKFLAGAAGGNDTSGVSQDQLGQLLAYMQDSNAAGCIFIGPPGCAKSVVAKAAGNEGGVPTIQLDLGAMKGSLVGSSEQNLRTALKVISAVSNGRSLWIATCNSIRDLPPELRRRFTLGTFYFDLPDALERNQIWNIWLKKFGLKADAGSKRNTYQFPDDDGWTGAEIRQACDIAWRLGCSLKAAAAYVVPVSRSAADKLEQLRTAADGRFLSASHPGVYTRNNSAAESGDHSEKRHSEKRHIQLEDE